MRYQAITNHEPTGTGMDCIPGDPWHHAVSARAICSDGKLRRVRLNQQADTFFSWPGRVTINGKTVKVCVSPDPDGALVAHEDKAR